MGIRPRCYLSLPICRLCISSILSTFDDTLELRGSHCKIIFHPLSSLTFTKKKLVAHEGEMQLSPLNKGIN